MHKEENTRRYTTDNLKMVDKFYSAVLNNLKTSTIRLGYVFFTDEKLTLSFQNKPDIIVKINRINYSKSFKDLNEEDAITDGFTNLVELKTKLLNFYPNIKENSQLTIISFKHHINY